MAATRDPTADNEISDFDNSDEDLASLLGDDDDDDDIFAKKIYGGSPIKKTTSEVSSSVAKTTESPAKVTSPQKPLTTTTVKPSEVQKPLKDDFDDDILNEFIDSNVSKSAIGDKKSSSEKSKTKQTELQNEETDFLDDLSLSQFSPSKDLPSEISSKNIGIGKSNDGNIDILDEFNATDEETSKTSKERRGSFFDDFLQKLSPKHEIKKPPSAIPEKEVKDNEEEDDILGAYVPTAPKKNEKASDVVIKSPKARGSLSKQVSFKDLSESFPETEVETPKLVASPIKEPSPQKLLSETKRSEKSIPKRSEKMGSNKSEDIDWLNFFKESPKKMKAPEQPKQKDNLNLESVEKPVANKSRIGIRRQSSADWLGLSDSKGLDDDYNLGSKDEMKESEKNVSSPEIVRPKTADVPSMRSRRQNVTKKSDDWLNEDNDEFGAGNHSAKADLSQILKKSDIVETKKSVPVIPRKDAGEPTTYNAIKIPKSKPTLRTSSQMQAQKDDTFPDNFISEHVVSPKHSTSDFGFQVSQSNDLHMSGAFQNVEQASALHTLQSLLDNSIQECNKLLKENESMKLMYEEKLKSMEEFHKNQRNASENSYKTLEFSLKQEFEIKMKVLEERLNLLTSEKENLEKNFKEKWENALKEHQIEMRRLKELHDQSINIMKEDHEEALARLKRLKEQELEAVLSTQVHSKSLQHLSDQLEARAHELALLQTKVEDRNQATWREKQALLDARERDLKALQNRLQRQLEDSEDERSRLQQLVLRLEGRLQKLTMEGEEDRWEVQQMKSKLTIHQKYLEEEQKLNQYQIEKEKEKLRISQDSLLHEQKTVLLQLAQERQQLTQEKIDMQSLAKNIKEEETKLNVKKLKEETYIESQKQFLQEEKNKLHFEKEKVKQELYQIERQRDSLQREKQQLSIEKEVLHELEMNLKRKSAETEEIAAAAAQEKEKAHREHTAALSIKTEQQFKMQQYSQQMQMLMDKERQILSEKERLMAEKLEFEQNKNSVLCTKCKLSIGNSVQAPPAELNIPVVYPLSNLNAIPTQVHQSLVDPNLVIWHIAAQKDREFLQEELAYLKSLKESSEEKRYN